MEIERKYRIQKLPFLLEAFPGKHLEQGYLSTAPVVRVRREDDTFYMTYKGGGMLARAEYNLPLTRDSYEHLLKKADGYVIEKRRYCIPLSDFLPEELREEYQTWGESLTVEYDVFAGAFQGLTLAEVEFADMQQAEAFAALSPRLLGGWQEVTFDSRYHNSRMSEEGPGMFREEEMQR